MRANSIGCGGNWIIDHVKIVDTFPEEGTLSNILEETHGTGGLAYNVSKSLRAINKDLVIKGFGVVGDDEDGKFILEDLQ
ncbi:MAG TPA: carbohydrate kinase family protein, partial [Candidatus Omnitrophica bacterium]|nr:carbohydrate kinase family protein [Candidatus Omnitrophota bacterium]